MTLVFARFVFDSTTPPYQQAAAALAQAFELHYITSAAPGVSLYDNRFFAHFQASYYDASSDYRTVWPTDTHKSSHLSPLESASNYFRTPKIVSIFRVSTPFRTFYLPDGRKNNRIAC